MPFDARTMLSREQFERQRDRMARLMADCSGKHLTRPQMDKAKAVAAQALGGLAGSFYSVHHEVIAILLADAAKDVIRHGLMDAEDAGHLNSDGDEARIATESVDTLLKYVRNRASAILEEKGE